MQRMNRAAQAFLARLKQAAEDTKTPLDEVPGVLAYDGQAGPRGIEDGGGYSVEDWDTRPDFIKEQTAGWDLLVTLSDRPTKPGRRS